MSRTEEFTNATWTKEPEKMRYGVALIEWESCGLDDIPTSNLIEFHKTLTTEINKRLGTHMVRAY